MKRCRRERCRRERCRSECAVVNGAVVNGAVGSGAVVSGARNGARNGMVPECYYPCCWIGGSRIRYSIKNLVFIRVLGK